MTRVLRTLLLAVMVIAVPIQGMAATCLWWCAVTAPHTSSQPPSGGEHAATIAADATHHDCESQATTVADEGRCSACAACVTALALPVSLWVPPASGASHVWGAVPVRLHPSHQPSLLDRPPTASFA